MRRWLRRGGAALAGLAVALSLPPWGVWPLAIVGLVALEVLVAGERSRRERAWLCWWFAFLWLGVGMAWMWFLTQPGYVVAAAIFATFHAAAGAAAPDGRWAVFGRPAAHVLIEAVRLCFPFGGVPLASLAISQAAGPLVGVVRVGGVLLLAWIVWQLATLAAAALVRLRPPATVEPAAGEPARRSSTTVAGWRTVAVGAAAIVAVLALAAVAPRGHDTGASLRIAVVQGGGPQGTRASETGTQEVFDRHLAATRTIPTGTPLDLVMWPENVIDTDSVPFADSDRVEAIAAEADRLGVPFSVGITEDAGPGRFTNAQVIVMSNGAITSRYDKVRRVPFGEYIPFRGVLEALGLPVDQVPNDAVAGDRPAVLHLPQASLGVVISWEVFFGGRARDGIGHGGQALLNPTNGSSYTWTILQTQQVASSKLRAIETGRWVVQGAPTGFSAFVSPDGDVYDRTGISEAKVITRDVPLRTGETWYLRLGDKPFAALAAVILFGAWLATSGPARRREEASATIEQPSAVTAE
jgi:apolipoprotein N-acyltransferase